MKQRAVVEFLSVEGTAPVDIHRRMQAVYGIACVDVSTVRKWAKKWRGEDPLETSLQEQPRCGRPITVTDAEHQSRVDAIIQSNRRVKMRNVAEMTGISYERVRYIITDILAYKKVCARWVPRMLTNDMKAERVRVCGELLARYEEEGECFLRRIVTGDESWVHHYDPENKKQSMEFRHKGSPCPKKFKVVRSAGKVLLTVFWDCQGIVHMEFLEHGNTVNSDRYIETLQRLRARLTRLRRGDTTILHHDNARPHTSIKTRDALARLRFQEILPHPAYSPDLAPSDFFLFPKLKEYLKGNHYNDNDEIQADVRRWCRGKPFEFFADAMQQLVKRWRTCVDKDGDYVEK